MLIKLLNLLDDFAIALKVKSRDRADTGERLTLEELIREQGFDPAEFESE